MGSFSYDRDEPKVISAPALGAHRVVLKIFGSGGILSIRVVDGGDRVVRAREIIAVRASDEETGREIDQLDIDGEGVFFLTWLSKISIYAKQPDAADVLLCRLEPQIQQSITVVDAAVSVSPYVDNT